MNDVIYSSGNVSLVNSTEELCNDLSKKIKRDDILEVYSLGLVDPREELWNFSQKGESYIILIDGVPEAIFGVGIDSFIGNVGYLWMLSSEKISEIPFRVLKYTRKMIEYFLTKYDSLENYIYLNNTKSLNWIKFAGGKIYPPEPMGPLEMPFCKFVFERNE